MKVKALAAPPGQLKTYMPPEITRNAHEVLGLSAAEASRDKQWSQLLSNCGSKVVPCHRLLLQANAALSCGDAAKHQETPNSL